MAKITVTTIEKNLLFWKYTDSKIKSGLFFKDSVYAPLGFEAIIFESNGNSKPVYEGEEEGLTKNCDLYFVKKNIEMQVWGIGGITCFESINKTKTVMGVNGSMYFNVQNSEELAKKIASLGDKVYISNFIESMLYPSLKVILKDILTQNILEKKLSIISQKIQNDLPKIKNMFSGYGLKLNNFIVDDMI